MKPAYGAPTASLPCPLAGTLSFDYSFIAWAKSDMETAPNVS